MNLAEALGIVPWIKIGSEAVDELSSTTDDAEFWCMADNLEHFWEDENDARWHLFLAILRSIGRDLASVIPLDSIDDYTGGTVLSFGMVNSSVAICLPSLDDMLNNSALKKQAWQILCANRAVFR